jgi:P4 family phage/plasmid primase-like protien
LIDTNALREACTEAQQHSADNQAPERGRPAWAFQPADYSDAGNAEAFSRWVSGQLLHCPALGWLAWSGQNWNAADHMAVAFATQYTEALLEDAIQNYGAVARSASAGSQEEKAAKAYLAHGQKTRSKRSIDAFLKLSENRLHVELDDLDADGYKLNCPEGLIDLWSGVMVPHAPQQLTMQIAACSPSDRGAAEWEAFLDDVTCGDASLKGFLQQVAGMAAVGKVLTETAVFLIGGGRNGKSTWLNTIAAVLGTYSRTMDISVLTTAKQNRGAAFAELKGRRLVYAGELEQGARLSVSTLKQICSTDKVTGERKYCAPAEFTPSHSLILCSNYLPKIGADDEGCWRRILTVPFRADFNGKQEIKNYSSYLVERAGGAIMQWILDGSKAFLENGGRLQKPDVVDEATQHYRESEDWLQGFLDECCTLDHGNSRIRSRVLYEQYRAFATGAGDYCRRERDFVAAMQAKGFQRVNTHNVKYWLGISLQCECSLTRYAHG